jgi:glycosyltransferase involved in cell wall biosynthesis
MTRVTFVSYDAEPPLGGQGVVLRGMRGALTARGHAVNVVAGRGADGLRYPRITGRAPLDFTLHLNRHPELVRRVAGDVVHAHGGPGGVLLIRDVGRPLVYSAHHTYRQAHVAGSLRRVLSPLEGLAYRRAAMVLAVSPSTADAVRRLGVPASRVEVLPPGIDAPLESPPPREPTRMLFAGRWEVEKGVLDAVAVMRALLDRHPDASAAVVGSGRLDAEVRRAAAGTRIEVLGRVDDGRLRGEFARAAVVLTPSRYEGLGLVALQAQADGALVVGYDVDGLRDAVVDSGLLGEPGNVAALLRVTDGLLAEPGRRAQTADSAMRRVRAEHSWDAVALRLEQVYAVVAGL